jgi:hypothetical protein
MRSGCAIVVLALILSACGSDGVTGPSNTTVTFSGRVLDYHTNAPVAAATVVYTQDAFNPNAARVSATTGIDGRYTLTLPNPGSYTILLDNAIAGQGFVYGRGYRGDLYAASGNCISRYGLVINTRYRRPLADATVQLTFLRTTTGADGWYRFDLECPAVVFPGGTTILTAEHRNFESVSRVVGRGVVGIQRLDVEMTPR